MTKKDYIAVAQVLDSARTLSLTPSQTSVIDIIAHNIAAVCEADNPRFDRKRFLKACGVVSE